MTKDSHTNQQSDKFAADPAALFRLRVVPWWTDACSTFLNNIFKWLPATLSHPLVALEYGGGNSTFYLLGKHVKVVTVESDDAYIEFICGVARNVGYKVCTVEPCDFNSNLLSEYQLVVVKSPNLSATDNILNKHLWDIVINDGISRLEVLEAIHQSHLNAIVILDNVEYCANWGRLERSSAKPGRIKAYRAMLRDTEWRHYIFEQSEGREGRGAADKTGWESPHRWASAVLWPVEHVLSKQLVSNIGLPIVNELGADDSDVDTVEERCPFDWEEMKWLKDPFPAELDLKLPRDFE